jgi:hypothetical protein
VHSLGLSWAADVLGQGTINVYNGENTRSITLSTGNGKNIFISPSLNTLITSGNVGIGTNVPSAKLDIAGNVKITDGTQGLGKILTSDANGLASWQSPLSSLSGSFWAMGGNSVNGAQSIGTTTAYDMVFKTNNTETMRLTSSGDVNIGTYNSPRTLGIE